MQSLNLFNDHIEFWHGNATAAELQEQSFSIMEDEVPRDFTPKSSVWNPLASIPVYPDMNATLSTDYISSLVEDALAKLDEFGVEATPLEPTVIGREAGDDRVDFSPSSTTLALGLIVQERVMDMSTSIEDTFISKELYNFCEVTSSIPHARQQSLEHAKKGGFRNLGYVDSPPLRLVLDVRKGTGDHSSTEVGKCSMLGIRVRDTKPQLRLRMELASALQDACLRTSSMKEPKSMPIELGGCGSPPKWGDPRNLFLYMKNFRKGTYDRVYGSAVHEVKRAVQDADRGLPSTVLLADMLRARQDYLHATYAEKIAVPSPELLGKVDGMPPPLYKSVGVTSGVSGVERRLVRAKLILPLRDAKLEWDRESHLTEIMFGTRTVKSSLLAEVRDLRKSRKRFGDAISGNSAFQNLLRRRADGSEIEKLRDEGFGIVASGRLSFAYLDAVWVSEGCKGEIFTLADLPRSQDMYLRTEVSNERTMKVPGLLLHPVGRSGRRLVETVTRLGLWQISTSMENWCIEKVQRLQELRDHWNGDPPAERIRAVLRDNPEWVADDSLITARVFEDIRGEISTQTIVLLTRDKRLCRQLAQTTDTIVVGVDPLVVLNAFPDRVYDARMEVTPYDIETILGGEWFSAKGIRPPAHCYVDTGSVESALMNMRADVEPGVLHREVLSEVYIHNGHRACALLRTVVSLRSVESRVLLCWPTTVTSENPLFTGSADRETAGGSTTSSTFSRRLRAFMH